MVYMANYKNVVLEFKTSGSEQKDFSSSGRQR